MCRHRVGDFLLAGPALADERIRPDYEHGRLSIAARTVPIGVVVMAVGRELGFEVVNMAALLSAVEEISLQDSAPETALSGLLEGSSYALQYEPDIEVGNRTLRVIVLNGGEPPPSHSAISASRPRALPRPEGGRPQGLSPEQAEPWPDLARKFDSVLHKAYGEGTDQGTAATADCTISDGPSGWPGAPLEAVSDTQKGTSSPESLPGVLGGAIERSPAEMMELLRTWQEQHYAQQR